MRCPWCGITEKSESHIHYRPYIAHLKCVYCHQTYARKPHVVGLVVTTLSLLLAFIHSAFIILTFASLAYLFVSIFRAPYIRMVRNRSNGMNLFQPLPYEAVRYTARARNADGFQKIKIGQIYPLIEDFDHHRTFSCVSPIVILKKSDSDFVLTFIYEHADNDPKIHENNLNLYDEQGEAVSFTVID